MPPPTKRRRTEYRQTSTRSHARFHSSHDAPSQTAASTPSPGGAPDYDLVRGREAPLVSALQEQDTLLEKRLDLAVGSLDAVTGNLNPSSNTSPNGATSLLSSASQGLSHTVGDLTSPVNNLAQAGGAARSGSSVAKLPNELLQTASTVGSSVGSTVENASNDLGQTVSPVGTTANFALDGATENLADGASTLVSGAESAVSTAASEISQAATTLGSATNDTIGNAGEILLAALSSTSSTSFHSFVTSSTTEVRIFSTPTSQIRFEVPSASSLQLPLPVSSALSEVNSLLSTLGISGGAGAPATSSTPVHSSTPYTTPPASISASSTGSSSQAQSTSAPSQIASTTTSSASLLHSIPIFSGNFSTSHTHASHSGSFSHASTTAPSRSFAADLSSSLGSTRTQGFGDTTTAYAHHTTLPASTQSSGYAGAAAAPSAGSDAASNGPPPAGTIAGGVVGGAAGLAVLLFIALLFVRWYRQRSNHAHRPLPASSASPDNLRGADVSSTPRLGMAERAGLAPFMIAALPARLRPQSRRRHQRLEGADEWTGASSEKGFTKLAGRKLPSQFSGGSTNVNPAWHAHWPSPRTPSPGAPLTAGFESGVHGRGRSDGSHEESYRDSVPDLADEMLLSPGPQRRITVTHGGPYSTEPTLNARSLARLSQMATAGQDMESNPFLPPAPRVYDRSSTPLSYTSSGPEGSSHRGSRFAEDV